MEQLDRSQRKKTQNFEVPVFSPPLFWLVFIGVLTGEWILSPEIPVTIVTHPEDKRME